MDQNPRTIIRNPSTASKKRLQGTGSLRGYRRSNQNELKVLSHICEHPNISRIELAKQTGLSPACMGGIVSRLLQKGLIIESGRTSSSQGRKPVSLVVRPDVAYVVGVDIGSRMLRVVVIDLLGRCIGKVETESDLREGREHVLQRAFHAIHEAVRDSAVPKDLIKGIGVAHSGVVDSENGLVLSFPRPGMMAEWRDVPLRDIFEKEFDVPVTIEDSSRTMAVAEKHFGLGVGQNDFLYITVGGGIGAAIFIEGKLYRGPGGLAGEFGHMTVNENGPLCFCGNRGCLEAVASCTAIIQSVQRAFDHGVDSRIHELAKERRDRITVEMIVQAAREGDSLAFRVLDEAVSHIGVALADVANLLSPREVILGGALFRHSSDLLLGSLQRVIKQRALEKVANEMQLKVSSLGSEAAALGAARLASQSVLRFLFFEKLDSFDRSSTYCCKSV